MKLLKNILFISILSLGAMGCNSNRNTKNFDIKEKLKTIGSYLPKCFTFNSESNSSKNENEDLSQISWYSTVSNKVYNFFSYFRNIFANGTSKTTKLSFHSLRGEMETELEEKEDNDDKLNSDEKIEEFSQKIDVKEIKFVRTNIYNNNNNIGETHKYLFEEPKQEEVVSDGISNTIFDMSEEEMYEQQDENNEEVLQQMGVAPNAVKQRKKRVLVSDEDEMETELEEKEEKEDNDDKLNSDEKIEEFSQKIDVKEIKFVRTEIDCSNNIEYLFKSKKGGLEFTITDLKFKKACYSDHKKCDRAVYNIRFVWNTKIPNIDNASFYSCLETYLKTKVNNLEKVNIFINNHKLLPNNSNYEIHKSLFEEPKQEEVVSDDISNTIIVDMSEDEMDEYQEEMDENQDEMDVNLAFDKYGKYEELKEVIIEKSDEDLEEMDENLYKSDEKGNFHLDFGKLFDYTKNFDHEKGHTTKPNNNSNNKFKDRKKGGSTKKKTQAELKELLARNGNSYCFV